ncbi:NPCBM/NEW2 domain-containing protein [Spirosoma rhododendri]|uniref:Glycoside hydrolase n=1 Tax=Spirosoma rhododendri TaxID=2728024 RepID=A0A7L5DII4_9BACT|nr:NPCBM/NEW2 domain-containing protein [Spirosoma rhododendri]QJD78194.1 glycoside hydrolase [Spirosoma rhododendri]
MPTFPYRTRLLTPVCSVLLLGTISSSFVSHAQTTYYVASSGRDTNDGKSAGSPFQSVSRASQLALQPGDQVLFRRGDTFAGTLTINQLGTDGKPIVVDAYGSGAKPILTGAVPVGNWTSVGNNVWQAGCATCGNSVAGVYSNGTALPLGRYPNLSAATKGYLTVQSHNGKTQLTSQQGLPASFAGGEAVIRPVHWILDRATITGQSGNTLQLSYTSNYTPTDGWGFFIQNHPATLDQVGEWYYNPSTRTIQLFDNQSNPNGRTITATVSDGLTLNGASYVTVRNMQITQTQTAGIRATNSNNLTFSGVEITNAGTDGIVLTGSGSGVLIDNCRVVDVNNNGVAVSSYANFTCRGTTIQRIGLVPGRGGSGDGQYVGLQTHGANTLIENNVVDNIGYNAITFTRGTTIQRNLISSYCMAKGDGGGIYTWNGNGQSQSNMRILSNIVYAGNGPWEGTSYKSNTSAHGIYLDDCTANAEVTGNTVFNCYGYGIYLHGTSNITLTNNTSFGNNETQLALMHNGGSCPMRNNIVQNNALVSRTASQLVAKYESNANDLLSYGTFDKNVYARPANDAGKILTVVNNTTGALLQLWQWQSQYTKDGSSLNSPAAYIKSGNSAEYIKFYCNTSAGTISVPLDGNYIDGWNKAYTGQATLPPFSSLILFRANDGTTNPVYLSDLNWIGMSNGYGPAERDRSNGNTGDNDGTTLRLNGVTYEKGLGCHANSDIMYNLAGRYRTFLTDIGIDDEVGNTSCGSVIFRVYADNALIYDSGAMGPTSPTKSLSLDVRGKQILRLMVLNNGDGCGDHGDWAGARLVASGSPRIGAEVLSESREPAAVSIYPVPAKDEIWLRYQAEVNGEAVVELLDMQARPVLKKTHQAVVGENVVRVPVSDVQRGSYLLMLQQGVLRVTKRVLLTD